MTEAAGSLRDGVGVPLEQHGDALAAGRARRDQPELAVLAHEAVRRVHR